MRLLIVSQYFSPENFRVNDLASAFVTRGHDVTVLTGKPNYPDGKIFPAFKGNPERYASYEGARIHRVPLVPRGTGSVQLLMNYVSFALMASTLGVWKLRGQRFDAIFVFQASPVTAALPGILLRRLKRAPLLMWILDVWPDTLSALGVVTSPRLLGMVGALVRFIYRRCDRILITSRGFSENVRTFAGGIERLRYFPNWAEPEFTAAAGTVVDAAPELAPYADDFRIVFAGNIGEAQDFPAILDAAECLRGEPRLRWLIVGDGRAAPMVRDEIARRGLEAQVILLGRHPIDRMPSFFAGADAMLVTLRDEPILGMTLPGKVQSYLAAGKPILGMLNGEGPSVIAASGAGFSGRAGDGAALAANVRAMMALSPEARSAMGAAGKAFCTREFDRETLMTALEGWIAEVRGKADGAH